MTDFKKWTVLEIEQKKENERSFLSREKSFKNVNFGDFRKTPIFVQK